MPAQGQGQEAGSGERRFADGVKTMVSGEAVFALSMSFRTSLIGRNDYVVYLPQCPRSAKKYFSFSKNKVRATAPKSLPTPCQRQANKNVANT
nr:hypothetical protein [uncultured Janthinobacterium sp.]